MLVTDPTEPASNWDFTPVFDLLRSPIHDEISGPHRHDHSHATPSHSESRQRPDVQHDSSSSASHSKPQLSSYGLGDFGSLWNIINRDSNSFRNVELEDTTAPTPTDPQSSLEFHSPITILKRPSQDGLDKSTKSNETCQSSRPIPVPNASKSTIAPVAASGFASCPSPQSPAFRVLQRSTNETTDYDTTDDTPQAAPEIPSKAIYVTQNAPKKTPKARSSNLSNKTKLKEKPEPVSSGSSAEPDSDSNTIIFDRPISQRPNYLAFVPGQVGTPDTRHGCYETPPSSFDDMDSSLNSDAVKNIITTSAGIRVLPADYKTATERRIGLMTKLLRDFPEYAQLVSQVGRSLKAPQKDVQSRPIHVFVDMSNIMVGFHDSVKVSRNIPISTRIRRLHMSFANFSLIMERGRSTRKRVLVGSDRLPSIDEAKSLGYEANILDRVHKVKHTTPRPHKFRKPPGQPLQQTNGGPETVGATNERWVEQGVDEILHLKILESLLDTEEPATIVLATGDAAAAEYSAGFMRMVERALQRGWTVELVSFSQVTSNLYRKKEFRAKWGNSFHLIELDSYVEELFD